MEIEDIQKIADDVWNKIEKTQSFDDLFSKLIITGDKEVDKMVLRTVCNIVVGETISVLEK